LIALLAFDAAMRFGRLAGALENVCLGAMVDGEVTLRAATSGTPAAAIVLALARQ
jgi:hypothetical protein